MHDSIMSSILLGVTVHVNIILIIIRIFNIKSIIAKINMAMVAIIKKTHIYIVLTSKSEFPLFS